MDRITLVQYQLSLLIEQEIKEMFSGKVPFTAKFVTDKLREKLPQFEINHNDVRRTLHSMLQGKNMWNGYAYTYQEEHWNGGQAMTYRPIDLPKVKPFTEEELDTHSWVAKHFPNITVKWKNR